MHLPMILNVLKPQLSANLNFSVAVASLGVSMTVSKTVRYQSGVCQVSNIRVFVKYRKVLYDLH